METGLTHNCTDGDGALADERDGHRMGAHAVARDAAGRMGDVEENGSSLKSVGRRHLPRRLHEGQSTLECRDAPRSGEAGR
jgi:hypothetical protein